MPSTILYKPGDVILVRYPFSDLTANKKRPALIVSSIEYHNQHHDVVILPITGVKQLTDQLKINFWQTAGLLKPSWLKPMVTTISVDLVERCLGTIDQKDKVIVTRAIRQLIAKKFV